MSQMPNAFTEPVNYLDKNVLVSCGSGGGFATSTRARNVRVSKDGSKNWGPTVLSTPQEGLPSTTGIQSSLVRPDGRCLLFLFSVERDNINRRPLVHGSTNRSREDSISCPYIVPKRDPWGLADGGIYRSSVAFVGHRWFYPRGYMLANGRILRTVCFANVIQRASCGAKSVAAMTVARHGVSFRASTTSARPAIVKDHAR